MADSEPSTNAEVDAALAAAVGVPALEPRTGQEGSLARSQRISDHRLRAATGWEPRVRADTDSWALIVSDRSSG